jgi:hypothetical protein
MSDSRKTYPYTKVEPHMFSKAGARRGAACLIFRDASEAAKWSLSSSLSSSSSLHPSADEREAEAEAAAARSTCYNRLYMEKTCVKQLENHTYLKRVDAHGPQEVWQVLFGKPHLLLSFEDSIF